VIALSARMRTDDLSVRLNGAVIVDGATLELRSGELTILIGPNGAGKTTLVRALAGLLPAQGRIELDGRPLGTLTARERARHIAYLPQGHVFHWPMAVAAVVALGRFPHVDAFSPLSDADRAAVEPTVSLDPRHQLVVMELLARAAHGGGAVLAILHDLALAARFADHVLVMDHGRLIAEGPPRAIFTPARIASVFGVEAIVTDSESGPVPILRRPV
jgi:iron complex transport system ATP-binding protein